MTRSILRAHWIAMLMAVLGAVVFFYARSLNAADERIPIYFEESTLTVRVENVNRTLYLPLIDIIDHVHLPYTNATVLETFTIGTKNSGVVVVAKNSRLILVNGQQTLLAAPVLRENQQWMVPVDFLSQAITRISGIEFRYKPGARRIFAGKAKPNELLMNAQALGSITRLTIGTTAPVTLELQRDAAQHRSVLLMKPKVVDPLREHLEYRDRLVRSIDFEDSDGAPKIIVETSDSASDVRLSSADEGRVHFIDFLGFSAATGVAPPPAAAPTAPAPAPAPAPAAAPKLDPGAARRFRVV